MPHDVLEQTRAARAAIVRQPQPAPMTVFLRVPIAFVPLLVEQSRARGVLADEYALQVLLQGLTAVAGG